MDAWERATAGVGTAMSDFGAARQAPYLVGATAPVLPVREPRLQPARRLDLLAHLADAFDLAEQQPPGHAARVAYVAHAIASRLDLDTATERRVLAVGLLHDAGIAIRTQPSHLEGGAWVAARLGFDVAVQRAIRATHERWDGTGRPNGLIGNEVPVEALCVMAGHLVCETAENAGSPLRARAELTRGAARLDEVVGPHVAVALASVVRLDETWLALWNSEIASAVARAGAAEERPSRRRAVQVIAAMGEVVDAAVREPGRARRVSALARALATALDMPEGEVELIGVAGHLMDLGQLGVPRYIADKPSILTVDEMELMRRHPGQGARMLESVPGLGDVASWIEAHHERPDGRGYPEMWTAEQLPLAPRVLAVADAYCALRARRPYRPALDAAEAMGILRAGAGSQFDATVVDALAGIVASFEAWVSRQAG